MFKLPSAYFTGVRVESIDSRRCEVRVKHAWKNQNPFGSMYFAVQAMAAELSTGALVMSKISNSKINISMLVAENRSKFVKKAKGKIRFVCDEGMIVEEAIQRAVTSGEGQVFWMKSIGRDESGAIVSEFDFQWTIKKK